MKKINPSFINANAAQPFKKGTWVHLQEAYQEAIDAISRNIIGENYDASKVYVLYGCVNSGSGSSYVISAGAVFYNGEIYLVDAVSFTAGIGETAIGTITTSNYLDATADPVTFTDGTPHSVHDIRKIVLSSDTSVGDLDYSAWDFMLDNVKVTATLASGWTFVSVSGTEAPFYRKNIKNNTLSIGGVAIGSSPSGTIFTLPTGYRPTHQKVMFTINRPSSGVYSLGTINIKTDGTVSYNVLETPGTTPTSAQIYLDGITVNLD